MHIEHLWRSRSFKNRGVGVGASVYRFHNPVQNDLSLFWVSYNDNYFVACSRPLILIFNEENFILLQFVDLAVYTLFLYLITGLDYAVSYAWICRFLVLLYCYLFLGL
jgi:hypothetical protein